jgi:rod shape-determining protein MreD
VIWKRALLLALLAITGVVVETAVLGGATLDGSKPELLLLLTVALAMNEGPAFGATAGFALGMATDVLLDLPKGLSALVFTAVGYGAGRARAQMAAPTAWLPIAMIFVATAAGVLAYGGLGMLLGQHVAGRALLRHAALSSSYNSLLTPFVFPVVRALGGKLRPAGVTR